MYQVVGDLEPVQVLLAAWPDIEEAQCTITLYMLITHPP